MKIVHTIHSLDPAQGGPPAVATRLAAAQSQSGHDIEILYADGGGLGAEELRKMSGLAASARVSLIPLPKPGSRFDGLRRWFSAVPSVVDRVSQVDVVHIHGVWERSVVGVASACRRVGIPYVVTPHGMLDPWSLTQKRWKKWIGLALVHRRMLNGARGLHVLNTNEQRLMEPLGLAAPPFLVPNGVFLNEFDRLPAHGTFRAAHPEIGTGPIVLFLSRLHFKKGLDMLAKAFVLAGERVPRAQLVVAGPDGGAEAGFRKAIEQAGLTSRVHLTGPLYGEDKLAAFRDADVYCLPSRQEGFSVAILEALACGVPVVISEGCHFPEVAAEGAGHVTPLEPERLADAMVSLLQDSDARRRAGDAGRTMVARDYVWPRIAERMVEAYGVS